MMHGIGRWSAAHVEGWPSTTWDMDQVRSSGFVCERLASAAMRMVELGSHSALHDGVVFLMLPGRRLA